MTTIKNRLGLALVALMAAGVNDCDKELIQISPQRKAHIIGYDSHDPLCEDRPRWEVQLESNGHNVLACVPFRDADVLNWSAQDKEIYTMTFSPKYDAQGNLLTGRDHLGESVPVVNLDAITAPSFLDKIHVEGRINLIYPNGANLCPDQRLYGLRVPATSAFAGGHRQILFCDERYIPFDREVLLTAQATPIKDIVGRPVYRVLDVKVLEEL